MHAKPQSTMQMDVFLCVRRIGKDTLLHNTNPHCALSYMTFTHSMAFLFRFWSFSSTHSSAVNAQKGSARSHDREGDTHSVVHTSFTQTEEHEDHFKKCSITGHSLIAVCVHLVFVCAHSPRPHRDREGDSVKSHKYTFHMCRGVKICSIHV